jgi:hypothetical protein
MKLEKYMYIGEAIYTGLLLNALILLWRFEYKTAFWWLFVILMLGIIGFTYKMRKFEESL